jgi:peptidoglycan/LPS O-acetylase OafA/YrhL
VDSLKANELKGSHFFAIDFLRGLAALSVLFWHYGHFYSQTAGKLGLEDYTVQPLFNYFFFFYIRGGNAVQLFWTLSGFVFAAVYADQKKAEIHSFVGNRIARLYPLHILTLFVVLFLQCLALKLVGHYQIYPFNDAYHFLLNVVFASSWGFERGPSFNGPIWSVSVEVLVYGVFMLVMRPLTKLNMLAPILVMLFFCLSRFHVMGERIWECSTFFFIGSTIYYISKALASQEPQFKYAVLFLFVLATLFFPRLVENWKPNSGNIMRLYILCATLVLGSSIIDRISILRPFFQRSQMLGDLTYSTYLWHVPIQIAVITALEVLRVDRSIVSRPSFLIIYLLSIFCTAYVSFNFFESPMRSLIRKKMQ